MMPLRTAPKSKRLQDALALLAEGISIRETAKRLELAIPTVEKTWLRYVVLPEWKAMKAMTSDAAPAPVPENVKSVPLLAFQMDVLGQRVYVITVPAPEAPQ
jgi:hypothetical protein